MNSTIYLQEDPKCSVEHLSTSFLKKLWDLIGEPDGTHGDFTVKECISVNGFYIDDIFAELVKRGEGKYVDF